MTIGSRIKKLRLDKRLSQEELAFAIYVSRQTISKWESDTVSPDIANITVLCEYFNVSADYLLTGIDNSIPNTKTHVYVIEILLLIVGIALAVFVLYLLIKNNGETYTINISLEAMLIAIAIIIIFVGLFFLIKRIKKKKM